MEDWVKASDLKAGDEIKFHNGETDIVDNAYNDPEGTWIDWYFGDSGYVPNKKYRVINL